MTLNLVSLPFVADAVLAHLQSGKRPSVDEAVALTRLPLVAALRARIAPDDENWVVDLVNMSGNYAKLGVSLIKNLAKKQAHVRELLRTRFLNAEGADASLRAWLFWKILDDPTLDQQWHKRLFDYAMEEWDTFRGPTLEHFGTPEQVLPLVLERLADASRPKSKQWASLVCLPVAADKAAAKAVILLCHASLDEFGKKVADDLLKRFFSP